jgi:uncharacterized membrane protein YhaH (DUF805 family)
MSESSAQHLLGIYQTRLSMSDGIIWGLANIIVVVAIFGCTVLLYRFSLQKTKPSPPIAAMLIIGVTALITGLQFIFPEVLTEFRRNREALLAGEWCRMVTPLLITSLDWLQQKKDSGNGKHSRKK